MSVAIRNRDTRLAKKESGGQSWHLFVQDYASRFPVYTELACAPSGAISARNGDEAAETLKVVSRE
jgi:hypothetical protein